MNRRLLLISLFSIAVATTSHAQNLLGFAGGTARLGAADKAECGGEGKDDGPNVHKVWCMAEQIRFVLTG